MAELIEALPAVDDLTVADADQVQEARDAYNALNNDQKQQLTDSGLLSDLLVAGKPDRMASERCGSSEEGNRPGSTASGCQRSALSDKPLWKQQDMHMTT